MDQKVSLEGKLKKTYWAEWKWEYDISKFVEHS